MKGGRGFDFPQGLTPNVYGTRSRTAEAVPFQITFMRPVLSIEDIRWDGLFPLPDASHGALEFAPLHAGKTILVTGDGGSVGSALAIHGMGPRCLVLLDSSEQNLYRIHSDLSSATKQYPHVPILGSVTDERCLRDIFARHRPEIVYQPLPSSTFR